MRILILVVAWFSMIISGGLASAAPAQWDENGDFVEDEGYREEAQADDEDDNGYFYVEGVPDDDQQAEPVPQPAPEPPMSADEQAQQAEQGGQDQPQDVSYFYDKLADYGEWIETAEYGWVWHPGGVWDGWRPYTYGRWVNTDLGWAWSSYFPWGWAAMHYGSWSYLDYIGWIWVPGTTWAPAWVIWRYSDTYIGWSPLLAGYGPWFGWAYYPVYYDYWTFINWRYFCDPHPHHHYVGRRGVARAFRHTYYPRRCRDGSGVGCARGPSRKLVTERSHITIKPLRIRNLATTKMAGNGGGRTLGVNGDVLKIYRPKLSPGRVSGPASMVGGRLTKTRDLGIVRGSGTSGKVRAPSARPTTGRGYSSPAIDSRRPVTGKSIYPRRPTPGKSIYPRQPGISRPTIPRRNVQTPGGGVKATGRPKFKMRAPSYVVPRSNVRPNSRPSYKPSGKSSSSKKSSSGSVFKSSPRRSFSHSSSHSSSHKSSRSSRGGGSRHRR